MTTPRGGVNLGSAYGSIEINDNIDRALDSATRSFDAALGRIGSSISNVGAAMSNAGSAITVATAPLAGFFATGIRTASQYEDALKEIEVRAGLSAEQIAAVEEKSRDLAMSSQYGPGEVADAFLQLLTSGSSVEEAMLQIDSVIQGASASGMDLGTTADALTDILAAFGQEASASGDVMQALAAASGSSSATMSDLVQGFANVGPMARNMGLSVDDTAAVLAVFSENGIKGAEAGTQLRSMLNNMTRPTDDVRELWDDLGISMYDARGNMRPLNDVIRDLNRSMAGMSESERNEAITTLAGSYGQLGLSALLASDGFGAMAESMQGQASVQDIAAAKLDTFSGGLSYLQGSLELLQITALQPLIDQYLTPLVAKIAEVVNQLTEWITANPELAGQIVSVLGVVTVLGPVLISVGVALSAIGTAIGGLGLAVGLMLSPLGILTAVIAGLAYIFKDDLLAAIERAPKYFQELEKSVAIPFAKLNQAIDTVPKRLMAFEKSATIAFAKLNTIVSQSVGFVRESFGILINRDFKSFGSGLQEDNPLFDYFFNLHDQITSVFDRIAGALTPAFSAIGTFIANNLQGIFQFGQQIFQIGQVLMSLANPLGQIRLLLQFFGFDILSVFEMAMGSITAFFETLNSGGSVLDAFKSAMGNSSFLDNILAGFFSLSAFITDSVLPSINSLKSLFLDTLLPSLANFINTTVNPAIQSFVNILTGIWDFVSPALNNLGNWFIADVLPQILGIISNQMIPLLQDMGNWLMNLWLLVEPHLLNLADWFLYTALPSIQSFISDIVLPVISDFIGWLQRIWTDAEPYLTDLANWFFAPGGALNRSVEFINTTVMPVINSLIGLFSDIWRLVSPHLEALYNWFMYNGLPHIKNFIEGPVTDAINGIIGVFGGFMTILNDAINGVRDFLGLNNQVQLGGGPGTVQTRDSGGRGNPGVPYLIGAGAQPELFVPDSAGTFYPNAGGAGGGNTWQISIESITAANSQEAAALGNAFGDAFISKLRNSGYAEDV